MPGLFLADYPGVIDPALRRLPGVAAVHLTRFGDQDARLRLLCQMQGPAHYADAGWLTDAATNLFRAGAVNMALRLLGRACDVASDPGTRAAAELSLQGIRIFAHFYADAACQPDPAGDLPEPVRDRLSILKAWAEMFGTDPGTGLARIEPAFARASRAEPSTTDDLFILNIAALGQLRTGQHDIALDTELRIESRLGQAEEIDYRAEFINAINLARLYRRRGEVARFRAEVDRAMATSEGLRSLSDIVQMNLIRATPGGSDEPEAHNLLRAALAWLALSPPEAISIRALREARPGAGYDSDLSARVSAALAERIAAACPGLTPDAGDVRITFVEATAPRGSIAIATPAAALLWLPGDAPGTACHPPSAERTRLAGLVLAALKRDCPGLRAAGPLHLGIDSDNGVDIPAGEAGLRGLIVRHEVTRSLAPAGEALWPAEVRAAMARAARVRRSRGLARIVTQDGTRLAVFKRYRAPRPLTAAEDGLLAVLSDDGPPVATLAARAGLDPAAALVVLNELAAQRVIQLEVNDA